MRRVVTALLVVMVAGSLAACSSDTTSNTAGTPVPASGVTPPLVAVPVATPGDILSPLPASKPVQSFPTDAASVPQAVLDNITAHKPMLVFWYDPTTSTSTDQRVEIDAVLKKYVGAIELVTFDYTAGIPSGSTATSLGAEIDKSERMTSLLRINTTPYIVFVDASGQITGRFAGFVDSGLIEREVMRATR
jgi:hypothetical protein